MGQLGVGVNSPADFESLCRVTQVACVDDLDQRRERLEVHESSLPKNFEQSVNQGFDRQLGFAFR